MTLTPSITVSSVDRRDQSLSPIMDIAATVQDSKKRSRGSFSLMEDPVSPTDEADNVCGREYLIPVEREGNDLHQMNTFLKKSLAKAVQSNDFKKDFVDQRSIARRNLESADKHGRLLKKHRSASAPDLLAKGLSVYSFPEDLENALNASWSSTEAFTALHDACSLSSRRLTMPLNEEALEAEGTKAAPVASIVASPAAPLQTKSLSSPSLVTMYIQGPASASILSKTSRSNDENADPSTTERPESLVKNIVESHGYEAKTVGALDVENFFHQASDEEIAAYDNEITTAVRSDNVEALRQLHQAGRTMQCSNRFGETILHMACRRGATQVVKFFLDEAGVTPRVRDDFGRTPLHDACWTREPAFELLQLLMEREPDLMLVTDKRGSTPMGYVRRDHWGGWCRFLNDNRDLLIPKGVLVAKK